MRYNDKWISGRDPLPTVGTLGGVVAQDPIDPLGVWMDVDSTLLAHTLIENMRRSAALIDLSGAIVWVSPEIEAVLASFQILEQSGNKIVMQDAAAQDRFLRFVGQAVPTSRLFIRTPENDSWLVMRAFAVFYNGESSRFVTIAWSKWTADCALNDLALEFGLTRTEVRVLDKFVQFHSPEEIAASLGTSRETVRGHLKRIYAKTGMHSGIELIKLCSAYI